MEEKITLNVTIPEESQMPIQPPKRWYEFWYGRRWEYQDPTENNSGYLERMLSSRESELFLSSGKVFLCQGDLSLQFRVLHRDGSDLSLVYTGYGRNNSHELKSENIRIGSSLRSGLGLIEHLNLERFGEVDIKPAYEIAINARDGLYQLVVMEYDRGFGQAFAPTEDLLSLIREKRPIDKLPVIVYADEAKLFFSPDARQKCEIAGANHFIEEGFSETLPVINRVLKGARNNRIFYFDYNIS